MKPQDIDRIQSAIDHIKTSVDIDPWAMEIAVEAMQEKIKHFREDTKKTDDLVRRQDAIRLVEKHYRAHDNDELELIAYEIGRLPSSQPKPCEDAVGREAVSAWLKQYGQEVPSAQQGQNAGND